MSTSNSKSLRFDTSTSLPELVDCPKNQILQYERKKTVFKSPSQNRIADSPSHVAFAFPIALDNVSSIIFVNGLLVVVLVVAVTLVVSSLHAITRSRPRKKKKKERETKKRQVRKK